MASLHLGTSSNYGAPVIDVIMERLPSTLALMLSAFSIAVILGIGLGWIMAVFANKWPDRLLTAIVLLPGGSVVVLKIALPALLSVTLPRRP